MDWKIRGSLRKGTDSITVLALRSAKHFEAQIKKIEGRATLIQKVTNENEDHTTNNNEQEAHNEGEKIIIDPKGVTRKIMKKIQKEKYKKLIERKYTTVSEILKMHHIQTRYTHHTKAC